MNTHHQPTPTDPSRETSQVNAPPPILTTDPSSWPTVAPVDDVHARIESHAQWLLYRAAEQLQRHGWRQGAYWPDSYVFARYIDGDPCCALGALAVADSITTYEAANWALTARPGLALAVDALAAEINRNSDDQDHVVDVADWNDDLDRTATEVITTMRAAARRLGEPVDPAAVLAAFTDTPAPTRPGAPSAKNAHQTGSAAHPEPNHQRSTSEEPTHE